MRSPFKFLDYFEKEDHASFFGREPEKERLYNLVNHHRLSLIYGPSGTGKTSLIRCGLANRFNVTEWLPIFIKRQQDINESLLSALKSRLKEDQELFVETTDPVTLLEEINIQYLRPVYLIFDQLEELYIDGSQEERAVFAGQIKSIIDAGLPCRLIFVLREEYLGRLYEFEQLVPIYYEQRLRVEPLTAPVVKEEVIQKSFALFNISLTDPGLADRMLENLSGLKQVIPLPYLQVYLDRLWSAAYGEQTLEDGTEQPKLSITPAIVDKLGTLEDVFAAYLLDQQRIIQQTLAERFPACPENFVRSLLDGLVTPEGTKRSVGIKREGTGFVVQTPVPTGWDKVDTLLLNEGLNALATARLLRVEEESVELAHDSLAAVIDGQRSAEERQLNLYRQQIRASFEMFPQTDDYLSKNKVPLYEENLADLALPVDQREYLQASKAYWKKIDEAELEQARLVAEEKLAVEKKKRQRWVLFSLIAGLLLIVAYGTSIRLVKLEARAQAQADNARDALAIAEVRTREAISSMSISRERTIEAQDSEKRAIAAAKSDSISRVAAENAKSELEREVSKGRLLGNAIGGSYDELIRQGEEEYKAWNLQNALTYWSNARFLKPGKKEAQELVDLAERSIEAVRLVNDGYWDESEKLFTTISQTNLGSEVSNVEWFLDAIAKSRVNWADAIKDVNLISVDTLRLEMGIISIPRKAMVNKKLQALLIMKNDLALSTSSFNQFSALTTLELFLGGSNIINDISSLGNLTALTELSLGGNFNIKDISPLANLTALTTLKLYNNYNLTDISPLANLTALTNLELSVNIKDINPLANLKALTELSLGGEYNLTDISPLADLKALTTLELYNNYNLTDISPLANLTGLKNLSLERNIELTDIRPLANLKALTTLELNNSYNIKDISPLAKLTALETLKLSSIGNDTGKDLSLLANLTALTTLELYDNHSLTDISSLANLTELTTLKLYDNDNLIDISPLTKLTGLKNLSLYHNIELKDISPLANLTGLTSLDLSFNSSLTDISPLATLEALRNLDIYNDPFTDTIILEKQIIDLQKALPLLEINR